MDKITEYLLSITAASIICVLAKIIAGDKSTTGKMISVISGVFMLITIISPLIHIRLGDIGKYIESYSISGEEAASIGVESANEELKEIIKQQTEAYILDEADRMSLDIAVEVNISNTNPPVPDYVTITGNVSPYNKQSLSQYISKNLGLSQENLKWK